VLGAMLAALLTIQGARAAVKIVWSHRVRNSFGLVRRIIQEWGMSMPLGS
jgi:hypothetical protein